MTRRSYDPNHPSFSAALEALRPEIDAIPHDELEPIRLDIAVAIVTALGVIHRVEAFRDRVAAEIGPTAAVHIDRLEKSAHACGGAHALYLTTLHGADVDQMVTSLGQTRRVLLLEAEGLVAKKRLPGSVLGALVGGTGYKAMCMDVLQLVSALRAEWTAIESHTPVTALELDQAEALANALATTLGENEQAPSAAAELRSRAYTFFVRTYDEVRRAISFVRWDEGDVDDIIPSLFAGRARKKDDGIGDEPVTPITPTNGSPTHGVPIAPGMPGAPPFVMSS
jgi:hypothetical protein